MNFKEHYIVYKWTEEKGLEVDPYDVRFHLEAYPGDKVQEVIKALDGNHVDLSFPSAHIDHIIDPEELDSPSRPYVVTVSHMDENESFGDFSSLEEAVQFCEHELGLGE